MAKKRNPQDSTLRNVRAAVRKIRELRADVDALCVLQRAQDTRLKALERKRQHAPSEPLGPRR